MNILLISPEFEDTFWSWKKTVKFVGKKAPFPPLALREIARMLPKTWNQKSVDLNVQKTKLTDEDIKWADYVFISAMIMQGDSAKEVIARCKELDRPVVLGGPILETGCDEFSDVSHFFLGEAEETFLEFLADLKNGRAKKIYSPSRFPDVALAPIPLWEPDDHKYYASGFIGYSRGCPYHCTFCNIKMLNGCVPRPKSAHQFLQEVEALYIAGFKGAVMLADDNFMGNKMAVKEMLPQLIMWQEEHGFPFDFTTEVTITIADDPELMDLMVSAGFRKIFLGLETPNRASLIECGKLQNANRDMVACIKKIQRHGLIPMSGFIVGFDNDSPDNFDGLMINFIQETGIVIAMVGVLQAPPGTDLCAKLEREGRMLKSASGNNTDCYPNFVPKMPVERLVQGYKRIVKMIYSPKKYYERIRKFLEEYDPSKKSKKKFRLVDFKALMRANLWIGLLGGPKVGYYYWKSLFYVLFSKKRQAFTDVVALHIYGVHLREIAKGIRES